MAPTFFYSVITISICNFLLCEATEQLRHTVLISDNLDSFSLIFELNLTLVLISNRSVHGCEKFWNWEHVRVNEDPVEMLQNKSCKIWQPYRSHANKYSVHGYHHKFETIQTSFNIKTFDRWLQIYELLTMYEGLFKHYAIEGPPESYQKPFYLKASGLQSHGNFIFSQLNKDAFVLTGYSEFKPKLLKFFGGSLPRGLQKELNLKAPVVFSYYCDSCIDEDACKIKPRKAYVKDFTFHFRSNDRLFCDVFWHYNVSGPYLYTTAEVMDDNRNVIYEAPQSTIYPHASNSICFEVKGVSFIILQDPPNFFDNLIRPFQYSVWLSIAISLTVSLVIIKLSDVVVTKAVLDREWIMSRLFIRINSRVRSQGVKFLKRWISFSFDFLRYAYSATLLFNLLKPSFPWTPTFYSALNNSVGFSLDTTSGSTVNIELVKTSLYLKNKIEINRPFAVSKLLEFDEALTDRRIAILIYSNDVEYYLRSRVHYETSAKYAHRIVRSEETARNQLQFISVSPAAPHLHFLVNALQRIVEGGLYDKWLQMEKHFYSFVSPILTLNYLKLNNTKVKRYDQGVRRLGMDEFSPTMVLAMALLFCTALWLIIEMLSNADSRTILLISMWFTWFKILKIYRQLTTRFYSFMTKLNLY